MKIFFLIAGIIILAAQLTIWSLTKRLHLYSETLFYKTNYFLIIGVFVKLILAILFSIYGEELSTTIISLLTIGYLICIVFFLYYKAMYFFSSVIKVDQCKKISFPFAGYSLLQAVIIIATSDKHVITSNGIVFNDLGSYLLIAYFSIHVLLVMTTLVINHKKTNLHFIKLFCIDCGILLLSILFECILKVSGSMDLILAFDCAFVMSFMENPKGNIDGTYGCFKQNVLLPFLEEKFIERKKCFIVTVGFGYYITNAAIESSLTKLKQEIIDEFSSVLDTYVFVDADGCIYAICEDNIYEDFVADTMEVVNEKIINYPSLASVKIGVSSCSNIILTENELVLLNHIGSCLKNIYSGVEQIGYKEVTKDIIDSIAREEEIKNKIVWALDNDKLEVFYQPIFSAEKNGFTTAEALARIRNDNGTVMLPGIFIPIAEKNGLIIQIGDRVYEKVCEFLSAPSTKEYNLEFISINLSNTQCEDLDLANRYSKIASAYNINPNMIEFEINEQDIVSIKDKVMTNMENFNKNGFRVALDGYGNKESTFYSLLDFPISSLKLDMHLIWNYSESAIQRQISHTIINMAHNLNIKIVAEGVETIKQLEDMTYQNVDYIQGYYFFLPMDLADYKQFLRPTAFEVSNESVTAMDKINSIRRINKNKEQ